MTGEPDGQVARGGQNRATPSAATAERFLGLLRQLPIEVDAGCGGMPPVVAVGRLHGLSANDATYLLLAEERGLPLATRDAQTQGGRARGRAPGGLARPVAQPIQ